MADVTLEDLRKNYSRVGVAVIEDMYGVAGYMSPAGTEGTDALAAMTTLEATTAVLDVGSGLGGPAIHLARTFGCTVTGIDLVETSVSMATERAAAAEVSDRVSFRVGDATDLPVPSDSVAMVWSQDAWCHVPDKAAVIAECARVLAPGGAIAFSDWLLTGDPHDPSYEREVLPALASPNLETLGGYEALLAEHGFSAIRALDVSASLAARYQEVMADLEAHPQTLTEKYGAPVYEIVMQKNRVLLEAFSTGMIGGGRFVASRRA